MRQMEGWRDGCSKIGWGVTTCRAVLLAAEKIAEGVVIHLRAPTGIPLTVLVRAPHKDRGAYVCRPVLANRGCAILSCYSVVLRY